MKTLLEKALECITNIFHQYAIRNPMDDCLQFKEFEKLLKEEAQPFLKDTLPPGMNQDAYIKQMFNKADKNDDGMLSFSEFLIVLGNVLIDTHNRSHLVPETVH